MVEKHLLGEFGENYLPMGNLRIRVNADGKAQEETKQDSTCQNYERVLDLEEGIATVSYRKEDAAYTREYFASYMDHLIIWGEQGICFTTKIHILDTDGIVQANGQKLFVTNATYCVFTISAKSGDRDQPTQVPEVQKTQKIFYKNT